MESNCMTLPPSDAQVVASKLQTSVYSRGAELPTSKNSVTMSMDNCSNLTAIYATNFIINTSNHLKFGILKFKSSYVNYQTCWWTFSEKWHHIALTVAYICSGPSSICSMQQFNERGNWMKQFLTNGTTSFALQTLIKWSRTMYHYLPAHLGQLRHCL